MVVPFFGTGQPAEKACFSVPGGFYQASPMLEIAPFYPQHHIRFTTNGNRPTAQSRLYAGPLLLDESLYSTSDIYTIPVAPDDEMYYPDSVQHCIVIRAAVFDENDSCISEVSTNSYFIHALGCDTHGLPAVSLCADSLDLFDYRSGILVPGIFYNPLDSINPIWTGNYYQTGPAWERPMNIEFYELNNEGINQQAGLRTHGGMGRRLPQKCLKCYAREEYGKKRFEYPFFENLPLNSFKHLVLKPFSASWNYTGVNNHLSNLIAAQVNVEALASRPVVLYLNGEYWGIYYIHERPDERYLEDHFDIDLEQVNLLSGWNPVVAYGTSTHFDSLYRWLDTTDLADLQQYTLIQEKIDLDNFIDYQILELFLENTDWPGNNMRCWQLGDGPWRWIFFDGDACLSWLTFNAFVNAVYEGDAYWPSSRKATLLFRKLLDNEQFSQQFYDRFQVLLNTTFSFANTGPMFNAIQQTLSEEIPFQAHRFGDPADMETWNTYMGHTRWFLEHRCESIVAVLQEFIHGFVSFPETAQLSFSLFPNPSHGTVTLSVDAEHFFTVPCAVYDMTGRQVFSTTLPVAAGSNTIPLDLKLAPGLYFMNFNESVVKMIIQ